MSQSEIIEQVCGWFGSALALFFFISPVIPIIQLMKREITFDKIPGVLLLCSLLNCLLWGEFGLQLNKLPVIVSNGAGAAVTTVWLIIYWAYYADLHCFPTIVYNFLMLNVIGEVFYICYFYAGLEYNYIVSYVAMVFNTLMFAAPGEKIVQVIRTENHNLIPIFSCIAGVFCSSFWGIYGLIIGQITMIIPNCLGVVFGVLQIICWLIYRSKRNNRISDINTPIIRENSE